MIHMKHAEQARWNAVFKKDEHIVPRKIADEMLLVPIRGELADMQKIFSLNSVAEYIWEQVDGKKTLQDILDLLLEDFEAEKELVETDILAFIAELFHAELIVRME